MWNIYGKVYDLTEFKQYHPGGSLILDSVKGDRDATAAFESYHAMGDIENIKIIMENGNKLPAVGNLVQIIQ